VKLNIGCGSLLIEDFCNLDMKQKEGVDIVADVRYLPFKDNSVDIIAAYHVFEHIPRQRALTTLQEWYRVLKKDGKLDIECPDFIKNCKTAVKLFPTDNVSGYLNAVAFIYGGDTEVEEDGHRWGYDAGTLRSMLLAVDFKNVEKLKPITYHSEQAECFRILGTK